MLYKKTTQPQNVNYKTLICKITYATSQPILY